VRRSGSRPPAEPWSNVIIETPFLTDRQKADASRVAQAAGAALSNCTGFSPDPSALYEDIRPDSPHRRPQHGGQGFGRIGNYFRFAAMLEAGR